MCVLSSIRDLWERGGVVESVIQHEGAAECCMAIETTAPSSHKSRIERKGAHYVFYCELVAVQVAATIAREQQ